MDAERDDRGTTKTQRSQRKGKRDGSGCHPLFPSVLLCDLCGKAESGPNGWGWRRSWSWWCWAGCRRADNRKDRPMSPWLRVLTSVAGGAVLGAITLSLIPILIVLAFHL